MSNLNRLNGKKIIDVVHSSHIWLSQTMTWLYSQILNQPGHIRNHVVCNVVDNLDQFPFDDLTCEEDDCWIWRIIGSRSWKVRRWRQEQLLLKKIHAVNGLILHSHFGDQAWLNIGVAAKAKNKHIATFYGYDVSRLPHSEPIWFDRYRELFSSGDLFLCEGPHLRQCLIDLGCPVEKAVVHHLGIQVEKIPFKLRTWQPDAPLRLLLAGTFVEKKGITFALRAIARIKDSVPLEITIIGDSIDQQRSLQEKREILTTLKDTGLESHTKMLGFQPHKVLLSEAYRNHIFISPSVTADDGDTEGGAPVSIIEMAATGMPVISSLHCDIPAVLEDGKSGLLAEERNIDEIEQKLHWLINNLDGWKYLAKNARKHIDNNFNVRVQGQKLANIYQSLADAP